MNSNYFIFTKMLLIVRFFFKNILENIGSGELMSKLLTGLLMSSLRLRRPSFFPLYYQHCVTLYKLISRNWNEALSWGNLKMRNTPFNET